MTGLTKPNKGKIELFGIDLEENFKAAIRPIGAHIGAAAVENMTPYQNLKMSARFYPELPETAIDEVLQLTGIFQHRNEKISTFSMGMKQRFGIASALLAKPHLVILDEPTNGLDIEGLLFLRQAIHEVSSHSGVTFVISSHHISELEKLCNRYCFIINGKAQLYDANTNGQSLEEVYVKAVEAVEE